MKTVSSIRLFAPVLGAFALLFGTQQISAHGVQVGYGTTPTGFVRIYIKHWHGALSPSQLGSRDNINVTVTSASGSSTFNVDVSGTVNNTQAASLPGLVGPIKILATGPSSNSYDDWGYWDFAPGSCNVPVTITINQGNSVIFTEETAALYPQTIPAQTFTDLGAPVITAPDVSVVGDCNGANVSFAPTVVDDCDANPVVTLSHASGSHFPIGSTLVTVTATDNTGKTSTKTFNVVVVVGDSTPPVLTVPAAITVDNTAGLCGAVVNFSATATDNCSTPTVVSTPTSGSFFAVGTTTVTTTATDANGNKTTKTFPVTVNDTQKPVITSPGNILATAGAGACDAVVTFAATATDQCPGVTVAYSPASGSVFPRGTTVVTATATDASGNTASTTFSVTVRETQPPAITTAAASRTVECDGAGNSAALAAWLSSNGGAVAVDNCGPVTWTNNFAGLSDGCGATGAATVVFTATDTSGNSSSTTATFAIVDTTAPAIATAAANQVVECDGAGNSAALSAWLASNGGASASDACGSVKWSNSFSALSDLCGATGVATVTFAATDECGNTSTSTATFTIVDTTAPVLASNVRDILPREAPVTFTVTATDICGGATASITSVTAHAINGGGKVVDKSGSAVWQVSGGQITIVDSGGVGTIFTINASAVDDCGNTAPATYVVNVLRPANEGVGNGVDGNTPGHDNNGGNDDPGTSPGNPGAKGKKGP